MKLPPILFAVLALAGCASGNVKAKYSLDQAAAQGHGLLIGSLSIGVYDSVYPMDVDYFIAPANQKPGIKFYTPHIKVSTGCDTLYEGDSDFDDVCAHIFVVDLPAGDYVVTRWSIENGMGGIFGPSQWAPVRFTIQAGKATYVGDLHMGMITVPNLPGVHGGWAFVHDERLRDLPVLERQYPTLNSGDVIVQILAFPDAPTDLAYLDVPSPPAPPRLPHHKP